MIILVTGTFLVQTRYYASQSLQADVHENARVATERIAGEIRSTLQDGIVVAGPRTLTVRSPIVPGMVCDRSASDVYVHVEGGAAGLDTDEVAGVAWRDPGTGDWEYAGSTWASIDGGSSGAASACASNGSDTAGATAEFHELLGIGGYFSSPPDPGDVLVLFRETTYQIQPSVLDTLTLGLFRRAYGASFVEFATGMDTTAQFQYRTGGTTYADTVVSASVGSIDAVRIVADARLRAPSGGLDDVTFGWAVNVAVRNLP